MKNITNTIKYTIVIFLAAFAFASFGVARAQTPGDFSGCWLEHGPSWMNCDLDDGNNNNNNDNSNNNDDQVSTWSATNIDEDSARLRGEVTNGQNVHVWFVIDDNDSTPSCNDNSIDYSVSGSYDDGDDFYRTISGLDSDTKYYYRACTYDDSGSIRSFWTDDNGSSNNNNNNDSNDDGSVLTTDATGITTNSAILNGVVVNDSGSQTVWFNYGTTVNLGNSTASKTVSGDHSLVSVSLSGLNPAQAYFFQLVSDNGEKGDIRAFLTKSVSGSTGSGSNAGGSSSNGSGSSTGNTSGGATTSPTVTVNSGEYLNVDLLASNDEVHPGDKLTYEVVYENLTAKTLENIHLDIDFPEGLTPTKTEGGNFTSKQHIEVLIPTLPARVRGNFTVYATVDQNKSNHDFLVSVIEGTYDHPVTPNTKIDTIDYSIIKVVGGAVDQSASALFAGGIFPIGFWGWLVIILIITIIILLARRAYRDREDKKHALAEVKIDQE